MTARAFAASSDTEETGLEQHTNRAPTPVSCFIPPPPLPPTFFFFNDTATPEIYTLSLHDAFPIFHRLVVEPLPEVAQIAAVRRERVLGQPLFDGEVVEVDGEVGDEVRRFFFHEERPAASFELKIGRAHV